MGPYIFNVRRVRDDALCTVTYEREPPERDAGLTVARYVILDDGGCEIDHDVLEAKARDHWWSR